MPRSSSLLELHELTDALANAPLNPKSVLARGSFYQSLGYHDLAVGDAYYALTLVETALDADFSDLEPEVKDGDDAETIKLEALDLISRNLTELGCLQDACTYHLQLRRFVDSRPDATDDKSEDEGQVSSSEYDSTNSSANSSVGPWAVNPMALVREYHRLRPNATKLNSFDELVQSLKTLPNRGLAHREVYPWNLCEPFRTSKKSLLEINDKLRLTAPNLEVRATELPVLGLIGNTDALVTDFQLGLFAKADLPPSSTILQERSIITAIRPIDASLCDLCASPLPELTSSNPPVACPECNTTVFCSTACLDFAIEMYHKPPFCNNDDGVDEIGRDANAPYPADDLYFLLVARTIAMAEAQDVHPLDLFETKYLCGEFTKHQHDRNLPFSFTHNILLPFRFFTTLMLSDESLTPYSAKWIERYDHWVIQTLFAKFRGVASARQSTWDAKPEVAAVHPLWCLANHSCNPNVDWRWGGQAHESEIRYTVQDKLVWQDPSKEAVEYTGIKKDEEIMNHYVDVTLPVKERREYAMGPLGGECRCERCVWEAQ